MSWTKTSQNDMLKATETSTLPSSATTEYSSEINFLKVNPEHASKKVIMLIAASAVSGTNLDIALYGAKSEGGTKYLLLDAIVADITDTTQGVKILDLNAYPAPYYYIGWTADADESDNTITVDWLFV